MRMCAVALVVLATIALASATSSAAPETKLPFHWRQPSWSPSGRTLAFGGGSISVGSRGLFRSAPTGKHLRPIAVGKANYADPEPEEVEWAPHGTKIAWVERRSIGSGVTTIFVSDARRRGRHQIARGGEIGEIAWAPSGRLIAFAGHIGIHVIRPSGKGDHRLTSGHFDGNPTWSPHGGYIAFSRRTSPITQPYRGFIFVMRQDGTGLRQLTTKVSSSPSWSPDGSQIAYIGGAYGSAEYAIYLIDLDGTNERRLTLGRMEGLGRPRWSPNGTSLAFDRSNRGTGDSELVVVSRHGSSERVLDPFGGDPAWSPGGKRIAYSRSLRKCPGYGVFVIAATGGQPRRVTPCRFGAP